MSSTKRTIYVGGLAEEVDEKVLNAAFIPFGDIVDVQIPLDYESEKHRGFAFIEFENAEDAAAAIDNMLFRSNKVKINICIATNMASKNVLTKLSEESLAKQPEEVFDIICKLGEGSYGSVYKALNKESGHVLAIKQVPVDTDLQEIIKEISIMQQCDSPYVVKYYGSYFKNSDLWIIMEFCEAGSVSDIIKLRKKTLTEDEIATILYDVLKGLEYLHSCRKIHRDIKAANILLTLEGYAKLADFGVACQLTDTIAKRNTLIGTPFWMAPEIIQEIGYNCVADIWSLGITALEMAEGKPPYGEIHPMRAIFMIPIKPPPSFHKPDQWSPEFIDFVSICLVKNPEERATAINLLQHVFINNAKQPNILKQMISEAQEIREKKLLRTTTEIISENVQENVMTRNQTMVEHPNENTLINNTLGLRLQREQLLELQSELGTMVINNDEKTMKYDSATAKTFYINKEHSDGNSDSETEGALGHCHYYQEQLMPIGNSFQKALSDSNYSHLKFLTYEELQQRMATLDADMEREIDELRRRYQTKGQPILDAMDNKRKRQQNF